MIRKKVYTSLFICAFACITFMALLFVFTKKEVVRDMSFKRGFLYDAPKKVHDMNLEYNAYYIAGTGDDQIYLGNPKSPLYLTVLDTTLQSKETVHLNMDQDSLPMRSPQLRVIPPYFFLMDGTIPYILRGNTTDWMAHSFPEAKFYFTNAQPMDSVSLAIRTFNMADELVLGTISLLDSASIKLTDKLLQKQVDGVFDTDGTLLYNQKHRQMVYTYRYRNQYVVANDSLQLQLVGKTIDTISQAQIEVGTIASKNQKKLAAPALTVNKHSTTYGDYLFVNSLLLGRSESIELWEKSSVIDVYNMVENRYEFSFYVEDIGTDKLKTFKVVHDKFIGLIGNHIVSYQLTGPFKQRQSEMAQLKNEKTSSN